ncbi:hypothetical protein [Gemmatimonas sp.]|uniref:hypothetical protein n=1 Tax=Gemmatimonas sp. TaxID=1962908 RepID=UPI0035670702
MEDLVEPECERHGLDRHVLVDEEGHAVAAIDRGITFKTVVMHEPGGGPTFDGGLRHAAAAVEMLSGAPATLVLPDHGASLRFVLAGSLGEIAVLVHAIDGGFSGDVKAWRIGMGSLGKLDPLQVDKLIGCPFQDIVDEVQEWAAGNRSRIELLAEQLAEVPAGPELSNNDVVSFLG